jgi:hypothetical protein
MESDLSLWHSFQQRSNEALHLHVVRGPLPEPPETLRPCATDTKYSLDRSDPIAFRLRGWPAGLACFGPSRYVGTYGVPRLKAPWRLTLPGALQDAPPVSIGSI